MITIEIIYALLNQQYVEKIKIAKQSTINDAILQSSVLEKFAEIDLYSENPKNKVGIYNQIKKLDHIVNAGDRVEIYRPLIADPKEIRRKRAVKQKQEGIINNP